MELIEELVTIKNKEPSKTTEKDYDRRNELKIKLFKTVSLHDAFANKYPDFCLSTVIWISGYGKESTLRVNGQGKVYSSNGLGAVIRVHPARKSLDKCLSNSCCASRGIYLYLNQHSNILWLDAKRKIIYRYDPQVSRDVPKTKSIDAGVKKFFEETLPEYTYYGNTLSRKECIQWVRYEERGVLDCFCQEYTLLYTKRRLNGMPHQEAAKDIVDKRQNIIEEIKELYLDLKI